MREYKTARIISFQVVSFPVMTQSGAELACSSEPNCEASVSGQFDYCCEEGADSRLSQKIVADFACDFFQPECDFQADGSTNFDCTSVSTTPLGECDGECVFLVTCEGFSGDCPGEEHIQVACTASH